MTGHDAEHAGISLCPPFDSLLAGGIMPGVLTHFFGPPASGKTNISLLAASNAVGAGKVLYVDPEGGFSAERLVQISGKRQKEVLDNTLLIKPTTFEEQRVALEKLNDIVTSMKVGLIVVDSIAMLYRMEEDKDVRMLGRILAGLLRISRKHSLPVLLTNQVYSDFETGATRPIGGTITEYFTKTIVELSRLPDQTRVATLRRHPQKREGEALSFRIVDGGIEAIAGYCDTKSMHQRESDTSGETKGL